MIQGLEGLSNMRMLDLLWITLMWGIMSNKVILAQDAAAFCQNDVFTAKCAKDEVVIMKTAQYGRMELSKCVKKDYGYIGCGRDVIDIAHAYCSGRRECEIPVPNTLLDKPPMACPEDFKSYLKAGFECQKVITADKRRCTSSSYVELTESEGLIASTVTHETECGSYKSPWLIKLPQGQRVNISLYDFSIVSLDESEQPAGNVECKAVYASIREKTDAHRNSRNKESTRSHTLCGGKERHRWVYTSDSNMVEILIQGSSQRNRKYFILHYKAIGCPDVSPPLYGWSRRDGESSTVGCDDSGDTWHLACKGNTWVGKVGNCTKPLVKSDANWSNVNFSFGLSIGIVILIALAIAGCILLAGVVCLQKRRKHASQMKANQRKALDDAINNDENYRKAMYSYNPKTTDTYWSRRSAGPPGSENEYASIQDNFSQDGTLRHHPRPTGNDDPRQHNMVAGTQQPPYPYPDGGEPQVSTGPGYPQHKYPYFSPDGSEPREYFVLDPESCTRGGTMTKSSGINGRTGLDCVISER